MFFLQEDLVISPPGRHNGLLIVLNEKDDGVEKLASWIEDSHLELIRKAISYGRRWQKSQNSRNYNNAQILATIPNNLLRHGYWRDGMYGLGMAATNFAFRLGTRLPK
jgi:hypothetical protein